MGTQVWSLVSLGVGLNLVLGALVAAFKLPIYLDSLGTVLVAALAGPWAAGLAGGCGVALLGLTNPVAFAFLPVGVAVGWMAGGAAKAGVFRKAWLAGLAGALLGCGAAALSAPISATLFGGVTGGGTDLVVALFRAGGLSTLQAAFSQGLTVDPLDKTVTFLLVCALLRAFPRRALAAFPLAHRLGSPHTQPLEAYRPQAADTRSSSRLETAGSMAEEPDPLIYPQAATEWKLLALLSLLFLAGISSRPELLSMACLVVWLGYALAMARLTSTVSRRLVFALLPLALSLVLVHGLIARQAGETRVLWLGLSWSPSGLEAAWLFLARVALILLALSMFFATTPLQRLAELLLRWRVPYPLIFVLLTGANLGTRLRQRWQIVEEAQQARGLRLRPKGGLARARVLVGLLTPTLGAVFNELPQRSANLESRGLLGARPQSAIPLLWTGEPAPTRGGRLFYLGLTLAAWGAIPWTWS